MAGQSEIAIITSVQGNFLIRLLLAHVISDFVFQTRRVAETRKPLSGSMFLHLDEYAALVEVRRN
jgi:hypothetical protein